MKSSKSQLANPPVIIIGAGRSGTNMLRDLLAQLPQFSTWPCDEINYIWRHGNRGFATDDFAREMADDKTARYIRKQFQKFAAKHPGTSVLEKTCANSLRCGFIHQIFPEARFIHIIRDGRDVAASAALRWNAKLDIGYIAKKARYVPWSDLPYYATKYLNARIYKLFSGKSRLSTWGPKFEGMQEAFTEYELPVGCAIQWRQCVTRAMEQLAEVPPSQVLTIRYEQFTSDAATEFKKVCDFLGYKADSGSEADTDFETLTQGVSNRSVGKWKQQLSASQLAKIQELAGTLLSELGYGESSEGDLTKPNSVHQG